MIWFAATYYQSLPIPKGRNIEDHYFYFSYAKARALLATHYTLVGLRGSTLLTLRGWGFVSHNIRKMEYYRSALVDGLLGLKYVLLISDSGRRYESHPKQLDTRVG